MIRIEYASVFATEEQVREAMWEFYGADIVETIRTEIIQQVHGDDIYNYKMFEIELIPGRRSSELINHIRSQGSYAIYKFHMYWILTL